MPSTYFIRWKTAGLPEIQSGELQLDWGNMHQHAPESTRLAQGAFVLQMYSNRQGNPRFACLGAHF